MTTFQAKDRRITERRAPDLALPVDVPAEPYNCALDDRSAKAPLPSAGQRRHGDRRIGERRKANLGPPPETGERRFSPDIRGVVFPLYYNYD